MQDQNFYIWRQSYQLVEGRQGLLSNVDSIGVRVFQDHHAQAGLAVGARDTGGLGGAQLYFSNIFQQHRAIPPAAGNGDYSKGRNALKANGEIADVIKRAELMSRPYREVLSSLVDIPAGKAGVVFPNCG